MTQHAIHQASAAMIQASVTLHQARLRQINRNKKAKKPQGQDKKAKGSVLKEKDLGKSKSKAKPKAGGSPSSVKGSAKPKDGGSPGVGKATAKPKKGGSPGIVPEIESGGGGRGGRGRGGKGAREGRGGARSRGRGRGSGAVTAMESKGGVQHSDAMSDGTVRLSAAPAAVFGSMASTGQHSAKSVDIGGSVRIATPAAKSHLSSSSSSSDSSSSSYAPNPPPKKHKPGEKAGPPTEAGVPAA